MEETTDVLTFWEAPKEKETLSPVLTARIFFLIHVPCFFGIQVVIFTNEDSCLKMC